jgi:hypothetical protein
VALGVSLSEILPSDHQRALVAAAAVLCDEYFVDLASLARGIPFEQTSMFDALPDAYLPRYTARFAEKFLASALTVVWKLRAPGLYDLSSVAEELALRNLVERAAFALSLEGVAAEFDAFEAVAFQDWDFELLFDARYDGIDVSPVAAQSGFANLRFAEWFTSFRADEPAHPFASQEEWPLEEPPSEGPAGDG